MNGQKSSNKSVNNLGRVYDLNETMLGETMNLTMIEKANSRLKFLCGNIRFFDVALCILLCNALMQTHFDCVCIAWHSNLTREI